MKHKSKLYQLLEQTSDPKERMNARLRKRRQRDREKVQEQQNPLSMILVVKNRMNGEILIIDKESYTPKYHEIIISPDQLNQAVINDIVKDPNFIQTETSKRILGDVKGEYGGDQKTATGGGGGGPQSEEPTQQMPAPMPRQEIPFTASNIVSGPMMAIGMLGGLQSKDLLNIGVSEDELNEFNSSQEIQQISMKIAKDISYYFKNIIGRNILEYDPMIIKNQMFQTSEFWKKMGGFDSAPKTDIIFRHKCINESLKNKNKECKETLCGCTDAGIIPSEQTIRMAVKYGPSPILSGKMNGESKTIMTAVIAFIDTIIGGANPIDIMSQFGEKEKDAIEKIRSDIKFIKTMCRAYFTETMSQLAEDDIQKKLEKLDKLAENVHMKIERILNSNILYQEMFLHESISGYLKFGPQNPGYSEYMLAILPEEYSVALDKMGLDYVRKIMDENVKFVVNMKSQIDESPDEKAELEACKIRYGGKCPAVFTPKKFAIRELINSYLPESKSYRHSNLKYLFEQRRMIDQSQFIEMIESANGIMDLMNIFAVKPDQITVGPVDFFLVTATTFSADKNIINVNGKTFKIPVHMDPIPVSDQESITEATLLERLVNTNIRPKSKKRRDYRSEYKKFHASTRAKKERAARVKNRRIAMKKRLVRKGDKVDLDHIDGNPLHNYSWNLHRLPRSKNRAKH